MLFATVVLAIFSLANSQTTYPVNNLPNPIVDINVFTRTASPWADVYCALTKLIRSYFYSTNFNFQTTDFITYDADFICEKLSYDIKQLVTLQKSIHDCNMVSTAIMKMVARKMLDTRAHTTTSVFNKVVLASFRQYSKSLLDGLNRDSVISILKQTLRRYNVPAKEINYITRYVSYTINNVYSTQIISFLERLEISHSLLVLQTLRNDVMTIVNGTVFDIDAAVAKVKTSIKTALSSKASQAIDSYKLRAYYIAFFKTVLKTQVQTTLDEISVVLKNVLTTSSGSISSSDADAIVSAARAAFSGIHQWLTDIVSGITLRNKDKIVQSVTSGGRGDRLSGLSTFGNVGGLVDKLGWVKLRIAPKPKNLLESFKEILVGLTQYKNQMSSFVQSLANRPTSEQRYHALSVQFIQSLISSVQTELKESQWVHGANLGQSIKG